MNIHSIGIVQKTVIMPDLPNYKPICKKIFNSTERITIDKNFSDIAMMPFGQLQYPSLFFNSNFINIPIYNINVYDKNSINIIRDAEVIRLVMDAANSIDNLYSLDQDMHHFFCHPSNPFATKIKNVHTTEICPENGIYAIHKNAGYIYTNEKRPQELGIAIVNKEQVYRKEN